MTGELPKRDLATLAAAARVFIPAGGALPWGADDLDVAGKVAENVAGWPKRVRWQIRALITGFELLPLVSGHRRRFSRLTPDDQEAFVRATYHHSSASRRLVAGLVKQLCYTVYLCTPEVEEAVGYSYRCLRSRDGVDPEPGRRVHH